MSRQSRIGYELLRCLISINLQRLVAWALRDDLVFYDALYATLAGALDLFS